eukprot:gnl/TRDRNA2_/TRDRNA2_82586_c0_seq1.p1 gnl/TRDRNA2_/TRDRNA2_82586_c0~~gnl/TRDRNA2_/TRDRNA2_82586_c0_seq1.p1  ORF type:complete len:272 (-),score=40.21 gnl/TRDRNA2_/TRDRNA2_82586_c0_seq1:67-882(-)
MFLRLQKELKQFQEFSHDTSISASPVDGDLSHWKATLRGPEDTAYQGGVFSIDIKIPTDYPFKPPDMRFDTKIWHPNISSQTGCICLDVLGKNWSPALNIRTALLSIQAMLSAPEPDDPQDAVVAEMYKSNRTLFVETAQKWTRDYAIEKKSNETGGGELPAQPTMLVEERRLRAEELHGNFSAVERRLRHEGLDQRFQPAEGRCKAMEVSSIETSQVGSSRALLCSPGRCSRGQQYVVPGSFALVSFLLAASIGLNKFRRKSLQQPLMHT